MALIAGAVLVLGGFAYLVTGGISDNLVYFLTPQELLAKGAEAYGEPIRLGGQVKPGTVHWNAEELDLRFVLQDGSGEVEVHARKAPPQMFREGQGVVVEGRYTAAGVFESDKLMVKHSNEYRAPAGGEHPKEAYRSLLRETES
ncbi:MAG: cytochrome c maturation protein CcmE [Longimicrobiales bacterium]